MRIKCLLLIALAIAIVILVCNQFNDRDNDQKFVVDDLHLDSKQRFSRNRDTLHRSYEIAEKSKSEKVNNLMQKWMNVDWYSEVDVLALADLSIEELSISDDLVELLQLLVQNEMHVARTAIDLKLKNIYSTYDISLIDKLAAMSGGENLPECDSFWYKSNGCLAVGSICNHEQFEYLISKLDGVPRRKAIEGYALKLAETDPKKALDLVISNLPAAGKWNVRMDGKKYDIDFSTLHYIVGRMSAEDSLSLFDKLPSEIINGNDRNSDLYLFFKIGFDDVFDIQKKINVQAAISLIEKYPRAYDSHTYRRLLYGNEYDPGKILQHIPLGKTYDDLLSQITVPTLPVKEVTDGIYIPKISDYDKYLERLDRIQSYVEASSTAPVKQDLLNSINEARAKAINIRNSLNE